MNYDALNDPPMSEAEIANLRREHQPCPECEREPWKGHWPWCSKAPTTVRERYSEYEQRLQYRLAARELGCWCPLSLGPHVHREDCVLYATPDDWHEHLDQEHNDDA